MKWKQNLLFLGGIGISNLGNWIYFIALNLLVLNKTGSAAAVAGLFVIRPIAVLITNTWSGSLIDRMNKRHLMIAVDCIRGALIFILPSVSSLWAIYGLMFLVNIVGAFFGPASNTYIAKWVPAERRMSFNSWFSAVTSGAFLLGPAVSGLFIKFTSIDTCIYINAVSFFVCAAAIWLMPNVDEDVSRPSVGVLTWKSIISDWKAVYQFGRTSIYFITIYLLFQTGLIVVFALDSQEATYIRHFMQLSEENYGLLVSLSGVGSVVGSLLAASLAKRGWIRLYISVGLLLSNLGYVVFYASSSFTVAAVGFFMMGMFISFGTAGYMTFFQQNVPVDLMGRFGSSAEFAQGLLQIGLTMTLGLLAENLPVQMVCLSFAVLSVVLAVLLLLSVYRPSKVAYYKNEALTEAK